MKRIKLIIVVAILLMATPSWAQSVTRNGKEWLQSIDFRGLSWLDVADVCPAPVGLCSGTLGGEDVTGYVWASVDDINALFNSYAIVPPLGPGPDYSGNQQFSVLEEFVADFQPTIDSPLRE